MRPEEEREFMALVKSMLKNTDYMNMNMAIDLRLKEAGIDKVPEFDFSQGKFLKRENKDDSKNI